MSVLPGEQRESFNFTSPQKHDTNIKPGFMRPN